MSDFVKYVVKLLGKGCPLWASVDFSIGGRELGHPSRYQPRPTGFNFGEQTGTGVFPLVIAVPQT